MRSPTLLPPPSSGLTRYTGNFGAPELTHLLKRTLFGATLADKQFFAGQSLTQVLNALLTQAPTPEPPLKDYTPAATVTTPDTNIALGTTWVGDVNNDGSIQAARRASFKKWWVGNLVHQNRSITEKMTLFWHNHFATETNDIANAQYVYKHHALLRNFALGNFKQLVKAITIDPGMLLYLNGYLNTAAAPDENYARELQELFCCGKGSQSLFTEADVRAAARVLTGWRINNTTLTSFFDPARHDTGPKQFSAFYNNTTIQGRSGANAGLAELDDLLNMIFNTTEVAKFICRKLYTWFVYYDIDATVEQNIIEPLAQILRTNNYEIKPTLEALLASEHFFDVQSRGCQIKSPVDFVIGACRELQTQFPAATETVAQYTHYNYLLTWCSNLQQNLGDPPDVSGWKAYYQAPQFYEIWINSDTLPKRNQFTDVMVSNGYTAQGRKTQFEVLPVVAAFPNAGNPNAVVQGLADLLLGLPLSTSSREQLKRDILLSGQTSDHYWTDAWNLYSTNPANTNNTNNVRNKLRDLAKYLMNLAEFQLS